MNKTFLRSQIEWLLSKNILNIQHWKILTLEKNFVTCLRPFIFFWVGLGIILISPLNAPLFAFCCSALNVCFLVLLSLDELWKKKINKAWGQMFPPELLLMSIADDTSVRWDKANNTPLGLLSSSWTSSAYSYRHSWCTEFLKTGFTSFQQET